MKNKTNILCGDTTKDNLIKNAIECRPKGMRIAQFIYCACREYETTISKYNDSIAGGIDIFNIEDDEFIKLLNKYNE